MDIVLGVSMTPTSVRMALVEGEKADGLTVDHDAFAVTAEAGAATAPERVVTAILGTRESAAEGGHRLVATGITWRDRAEAAALRDALAEHGLDDVLLVSELHAAGALAQAVGRTVGYQRTALMFLERDIATMSVVDTADGSIVKVESRDLHSEDAVTELTSMIAALEDLEAPPQGVFVVGSGVNVAAIKLELESATTLPVSAPDEAELALARGAALAGAGAPRFEASTVGLTPGAPVSLAYSEVGPAVPVDLTPELSGLEHPDPSGALDFAPDNPERKPFLLVGSVLTSIFVIGVSALVVSLAVSIRPTVDQRPAPAEAVIVPERAPMTPIAEPPAAPAPLPETIPAPQPVAQELPQPQAPRTVLADAPQPIPAAPAAPAPIAPAPAPAPPPAAAPPPAPAAPPVPVPAAPVPVPVPEAPVPAPIVRAPSPVAPYIPPVIVLPEPKLPSIFRPPWDREQPQRREQQQPRWPAPTWPGQQAPITVPQRPAPATPQQPIQLPVPQTVPQPPVQRQPVQQDPPRKQRQDGNSESRRGGSDSKRSGSDDSIFPWPFGSFG